MLAPGAEGASVPCAALRHPKALLSAWNAPSALSVIALQELPILSTAQYERLRDSWPSYGLPEPLDVAAAREAYGFAGCEAVVSQINFQGFLEWQLRAEKAGAEGSEKRACGMSEFQTEIGSAARLESGRVFVHCVVCVLPASSN